MTGPWWGKDVDPEVAAVAAGDPLLGDPDRARAGLPKLTAQAAPAIAAEIAARRGGFTPDWPSLRPDDPGNALIAVYAEQHAVLAAAVDDLPTKARIEHLRAAGVVRRAPRPLEATLAFAVSPNAPGGALVGEGFEVLGRDATGALVPFETARTLYVLPVALAVLGRRTGGRVASLPIPGPDLTGRVSPFGREPRTGTALYLGFAAAIAPSPQLTLGVVLAAPDAPPPISSGGLFPARRPYFIRSPRSCDPADPSLRWSGASGFARSSGLRSASAPGAEPPLLAWEIYDGRQFVPLEVVLDETLSFTRSGVIELVLAGWRAGTPPGADPAKPLYWIRALLQDGAWPVAPVIRYIGPNLVRARSGRTVQGEIVETPLVVDRAARRVLTLAARPVLEGTLRVQIDEGGGALVPWTAVASLSETGPDDRVFVLDAATGTLTFGDERTGHGRPLPDGFRHVHATYRAAAEAAEVAAGAISTLAGSAPFLTSVINLDAASGGATVEDLPATLLRGPREIRARGRAVALADYEVLALGAPGADIRRAHAASGQHPRFPGRRLPGVVAVYVVGAARRDGAPPVPTEATLRGVSEHLTAWAPRGAEVVAVAPRFHEVRVEASLELAHQAPITETVRAVSLAIDRWFDPVTGGEHGEGWPFGGAIRYDALARFLLGEVDGVLAIPRLLLVVDGVRSRLCPEVAIPEHDLLWKATHELFPLPRRAP